MKITIETEPSDFAEDMNTFKSRQQLIVHTVVDNGVTIKLVTQMPPDMDDESYLKEGSENLVNITIMAQKFLGHILKDQSLIDSIKESIVKRTTNSFN